jgi:hypothetical protein
MFRSVLLAFALFCGLSLAVQPAFAARLDAGAFSAELPDGWTMSKEGEMTTFAEPAGPLELMVILKNYGKTDIKEIINEMAGQTPVKMLTDTIYLYEDSSGGRGWSMLASDGIFVDITAGMDYVDIKAFLAGLKAAQGKQSAALTEIFKAASSKEAVDWLGYVTPPFAKSEVNSDAGDSSDQGDAGDTGDTEDEGTLYEHKTFAATVPTGWTAAEQGESVTFSSDAKDGFVIVRVFTLASDDSKAFAKWAEVQAKAIGGKDINVGEGVVEFTTEKGANGMFTQFDKKSLFLLFGGDNPQIDNLIKSIGLVY